MNPTHIDNLVRQEFSILPYPFQRAVAVVHDLGTLACEEMKAPGVFLLWSQEQSTLFVGKSRDDALAAAWKQWEAESRRTENGRCASHFVGRRDVCLVTYTVTTDSRWHWVVALEAFLQSRTVPKFSNLSAK